MSGARAYVINPCRIINHVLFADVEPEFYNVAGLHDILLTLGTEFVGGSSPSSGASPIPARFVHSLCIISILTCVQHYANVYLGD